MACGQLPAGALQSIHYCDCELARIDLCARPTDSLYQIIIDLYLHSSAARGKKVRYIQSDHAITDYRLSITEYRSHFTCRVGWGRLFTQPGLPNLL